MAREAGDDQLSRLAWYGADVREIVTGIAHHWEKVSCQSLCELVL